MFRSRTGHGQNGPFFDEEHAIEIWEVVTTMLRNAAKQVWELGGITYYFSSMRE